MYTVRNMEQFSKWLEGERLRHAWSQNELATRAGIGRAVVNKVESGAVEPAPKTLIALARAFGVPVANLYRLVGYLPPTPDSDPLTDEGVHILQHLVGEHKVEAVRYLRLRQQVQEEQEKNVRKRKERVGATD